MTVGERPHCRANARALPLPMANLSRCGKLSLSSAKFGVSKSPPRIPYNKFALDIDRYNV
jgi:hypothetical protein